MKSSITCGFALVTAFCAAPCQGYFASDAGRPAARPLPTYCQMGECTVQTVEATDPIAFATKGVLFRVNSQNWESSNTKQLHRGADSTAFVLCSKAVPAVVYQQGSHRFGVTFLSPNDGQTYDHSNETSLAMYFVVCHARAFDHESLFDQGPSFAKSLGYVGHARDDQPTFDAPEQVMELLK